MLGDGQWPREEGSKVGPVGDGVASAQHFTPLLRSNFRMNETIRPEGAAKKSLLIQGERLPKVVAAAS